MTHNFNLFKLIQRKDITSDFMTLMRNSSLLPLPLPARQVAKNTLKRVPGVTMHSPSGCSSPRQEFSSGDPLECLTIDLASTKNVSY